MSIIPNKKKKEEEKKEKTPEQDLPKAPWTLRQILFVLCPTKKMRPMEMKRDLSVKPCARKDGKQIQTFCVCLDVSTVSTVKALS